MFINHKVYFDFLVILEVRSSLLIHYLLKYSRAFNEIPFAHMRSEDQTVLVEINLFALCISSSF